MLSALGAELSNYAVGLVGCAVACVGFGCNLVPLKFVETGDGMFYQWVQCSAIWFVGLMVHILRNSPTFYPLAMLGGFLWSTGNITCVPILKMIGLGPGLLIWASVNMITGWMTGHFGWFGLHPDQVTRPTLNYIGFALSLLRLVIFIGIKPDPVGVKRRQREQVNIEENANNERSPLLNSDQHAVNASEEDRSTEQSTSSDASWVDSLTLRQKQVGGCVLSVFAGFLYGVNFVPCLWVQQNVEGASQDGLDYVFAHFCGIMVSGSSYFLIYTAYMQNTPQYPKNIVLPSVMSGVLWAVAQSGWFIGNTNLTESVAFPIVTTGPSILAALWSVFYFREIRGVRNYIFLSVALLVAAAGVTLSALSKA